MAQNHTWLRPTDLGAAPITDEITRPYEATWYVLRGVEPDSDVRVVLSGCAVDYSLLCFTDLRSKAQELIDRAPRAADVAHQQVVQSGDTSAEDMDSEDMDSEDMDSEDMDSEDMDSEDMDSEDMDSEDMDSADLAGDGLATDPEVDRLAPVYAAAQRRALRAASITPGVADEIIFVSTRDYAGDLYFSVRGHEGAYAPGRRFTISATKTRSRSCAGAPRVSKHGPPPEVRGKRTLILTHSGRLDFARTTRESFLRALGELAAKTEGVVVDLAENKVLGEVYTDWDAYPICVPQANAVVESIRSLIDDLAKANDLEYVVIAGPDNAVPFARIPDRAEVARESRWVGHYRDETPLESAIGQGFFLTDNAYGAPAAIDRLGVPLYVPRRAVGRLVESAKDIEDHVRWYLAQAREIDIQDAVVSGYGFVEDLAARLESTLQAAGATVDRLPGPKWTATDVRDRLVGQHVPPRHRFDVIALQGHYLPYRLLAADELTRFYVDEIGRLAGAVPRYEATLFATIGCHSGHNLLDTEASPRVQYRRSFAETLLPLGGSLIGGTGYQYGDSELLKNSELLYAYLFEELTFSEDPDFVAYRGVVTLGQALRNAKARYAGELLRIRGIDEKAVGVATLYGLPMMPVRAASPRPRPRVALALAFTGDDVQVATAELAHDLVQDKPGHDEEKRVRYSLRGRPDSTEAAALRPVLPARVDDVTTDGAVVTGAMWVGGTYQDERNALMIGRPATERVGRPPSYRNSAFLPARPYRVNQLQTARQNLVVAPLQFDATSGTLRKWGATALRVFRRPAAAVTPHDAPLLMGPRVRATDTEVETGVDVRHYAEDREPLDVRAAYLSDARPGALLSVTLNGPVPSERDGRSFVRRMRATIPLSDRPGLRVFFQAAGANGRVASLTNAGRLYPVEDAPVNRTATTLTIQSPAEALHRDTLHVRATLRDRNGTALPDQPVLLRLSSSRVWAVTKANGVAEDDLIVNVPPRDQPFLVVASFVENDRWLSSAASAELRVRKARVRIDRGASDMALDDNVAIARVLHETRSAAGPMVPLGDRPVEIAVAARTFWYRLLAAFLPAAWLPTGPVRYAVTDPDGYVLLSPDEFGLASGSSVEVTVRFRENPRFAGAVASVPVELR